MLLLYVVNFGASWRALTCGNLEVNAVAEVSVAAVSVDVALCPAAVERLSRRHQLVLVETGADVLLLAFEDGGGGHAGSVGLTQRSSLLTFGSGAVTPKCCENREFAVKCDGLLIFDTVVQAVNLLLQNTIIRGTVFLVMQDHIVNII